MIHPALDFGDVPGKGRGIFTKEAIGADVVVELSPVVLMTRDERAFLEQTLLHDYIFEWDPEGADLCCMAQGYVSVYNHSYTSNCEYFMNYDDRTIQIKTVRDIAAGEELTINYNGDWDENKPVWFAAH